MTPEQFGFTSWFRDQIDVDRMEGLTPARVTAVHKGECDVSDGAAACPAKTTGRLRHQARSKLDYPTVGDWVLVRDFNCGDFGTIQTILRRRSELKRKTAGRTSRYQLIAANLDVAFIMQTLGPGFNLQRLERYLVMVNESGIEPVVLLSKADLVSADELAAKRAEILERMPDVTIRFFSNTTGDGLAEVMALFRPGTTSCIIGSSGVGKTTLLNNLLGIEDHLFTLPVREKDGKGLHSTTWRELIALDNGALVIDTPGMRELGNLDVDEGIGETFDDIMELSAGCRFNDCAHVNTPGCAVTEAVARGVLSEKRYNNYIRLMKEAAFHEQSALDKREQDRRLGRFYRSVLSDHRKYKGDA